MGCFHFLAQLLTVVFIFSIQSLRFDHIRQCFLQIFLALDINPQKIKMLHIIFSKLLPRLLHRNLITHKAPKHIMHLVLIPRTLYQIKQTQQELTRILLHRSINSLPIKTYIFNKLLGINCILDRHVQLREDMFKFVHMRL